MTVAMLFGAVCVLLAISVCNVRSDLSKLHGTVEKCVKELGLDLTFYAKWVDTADDDGAVTSGEMEEMRASPGGPCLLKCVVTYQGCFKPNGELIEDANTANLDISSCAIKTDDLCDQVSRHSICIVKLMEAKGVAGK